jgi:hypothetical protein
MDFGLILAIILYLTPLGVFLDKFFDSIHYLTHELVV